MPSCMGIEVKIGGKWELVAAAEMNYKKALNEVPKIAAAGGHVEYRVKRLTPYQFLQQVNKTRQRPTFQCPYCGGPLLLEGQDPDHGECELCHRISPLSEQSND